MSVTWQTKRLRFVAPTTRQILPYRPVGMRYIGLENIESGSGKLLLDTEQEQVDSSVVTFNERSVLFGKLRPYLAKVATPNFCGVASTEIMVFEPTDGNDQRFLSYSLLSDGFIKRVSAMVDGAKMPRANPDDVLNLPLDLPCCSEQRRIAVYLDDQTGKIDRLMDMRRRQMALLKEQRAALIQEAVTRGLNPNALMKDSGLPWLGEVPARWQTTRLAHQTTKIGDGLHGTPEYVNESPYRFINGNNLSGGAVRITSTTGCVGEDEFKKHRVDLDESSLLMSINGTIGNVACYEGESIILGKSAAYINCANGLSRRFLFYFLQSKSAENFFQLEVTGTTILNLSLASIRNLPIVLPSLDEQKQIVDFIEMECTKLDSLHTSYALQLSLLAEYRAALIHECVTGQRPVPDRHAQAEEALMP